MGYIYWCGKKDPAHCGQYHPLGLGSELYKAREVELTGKRVCIVPAVLTSLLW